MWTLQEFHWVISNENMLTGKGAGSRNWILPVSCLNFRPISEPMEQMCNVSLHCFAIGGLPFPVSPPHLACFLTVPHPLCHLSPPPHEPACSHLSLWLRVQGTAKEIPPTEKPEHFWQTNVVSNSSRLSQSPYNLLRHKSSHRKHELETTAKCLGGGCSCGEGGVHFTKLTQRLLSGMTDGEREDGWWMRARTAVFLLVLPQRSENPVDDPNPTCCHNWLPGVQMSRCWFTVILKCHKDWHHPLITAVLWISNCCLWAKASWSCM